MYTGAFPGPSPGSLVLDKEKQREGTIQVPYLFYSCITGNHMSCLIAIVSFSVKIIPVNI